MRLNFYELKSKLKDRKKFFRKKIVFMFFIKRYKRLFELCNNEGNFLLVSFGEFNLDIFMVTLFIVLYFYREFV